MISSSPTKAPATLLTRFEEECVLFFAEAVQIFGVPKSVGQIYGLLYASPIPLGFPDIVEKLEMSKGSASQGLQLLRSLGAITVADGVKPVRNSFGTLRIGRLSKPPRAERSVVYEPELSLRKLVSGVLRERIGPMTATSTERLARLRELAEEGGAEREFLLDRAKQLNSWRRRLKAVLPLLNALLGPKK